MFKSATFKLTMWYLAIAMAISLIFSVALYQVTTDELRRGLNRESESLFDKFPVFEHAPQYGFEAKPLYKNGAHRIFVRLVIYNFLVLLAAGITSYWLAKRTLEPIEAIHEQQKRFTADVSHELRTPLTAMKMQTEVALMNKSTKPDEFKNILSSNLEEALKMEQLINSLLKMSRLEAEELQNSFISLSSKEILESSINKIKGIAKNRSISIKTDIKESKVLGDQDSLVHLMVILLDNAVKYSKNKSTVNVTAYKNKEMAVWRIEDHGKGIDPNTLDRVFDRFYRGESNESRSKFDDSGYGLGLSIAKQIADFHRGTITISSQLDEGTTVIVYIPLYKPAA